MKLFDLDGTLIDSNGLWQEVDRIFLTSHGLKSTPEYLDTVSHSIFPIAAQYTKDYYSLDISPEQIMDEWMALAHEAYEHHIPLKGGVYDFLVQETQKGEQLALVSACVPELGYAALNRHGLTPLFDHLIFAQEHGLEKRDPRFFQKVLDYLRVSPAECTLYEDAPDNCFAAKNLGMTVVGVLDPLFASEADRMKKICDQCITDFSQLID